MAYIHTEAVELIAVGYGIIFISGQNVFINDERKLEIYRCRFHGGSHYFRIRMRETAACGNTHGNCANSDNGSSDYASSNDTCGYHDSGNNASRNYACSDYGGGYDCGGDHTCSDCDDTCCDYGSGNNSGTCYKVFIDRLHDNYAGRCKFSMQE
jgi:hypothetical protein